MVKIILHTLKKYQDDIPCSFPYKVLCTDDKFSKPVALYRAKNAINRFIEVSYCKKIIKMDFNDNLVMSQEDEERFQWSYICWICDKLFDAGNNKVRDHSHITSKYRDSAY